MGEGRAAKLARLARTRNLDMLERPNLLQSVKRRKTCQGEGMGKNIKRDSCIPKRQHEIAEAMEQELKKQRLGSPLPD